MAAKPIGFLPEAFFGLTGRAPQYYYTAPDADSGMFYGFHFCGATAVRITAF